VTIAAEIAALARELGESGELSGSGELGG
jgi:hypothetical protein